MKKIKAIIFDVAGVMTTLEDKDIVDHSIKQYKIKKEIFEPIYYRYLYQYERNQISEEQFLKRLFKAINRPFDKDFLNKKFSFKKPKPKVMQFVKSLNKRYKVYYLTNEGEDYWKKVLKKYKIHKLVKKGFASYQIGSRKPSRKVFKYILRIIKCKPKEVIFIDDTKKNVNGALKVGLNAVQFNNLKQIKNGLKKFGVK